VQIEKLSPFFTSTTAKVVIAGVAVVSAATIVLASGIIDWLACESEGSAACDRQSLAHAQVIVGWIAAGVLLVSGALQFWRRGVVAAIALVFAAASVVTWALMADAAVHGWDDLKFFPF
jgi:hypothetical protein